MTKRTQLGRPSLNANEFVTCLIQMSYDNKGPVIPGRIAPPPCETNPTTKPRHPGRATPRPLRTAEPVAASGTNAPRPPAQSAWHPPAKPRRLPGRVHPRAVIATFGLVAACASVTHAVPPTAGNGSPQPSPDRVTRYATPRPLAHDAVQRDWPAFLGPSHNATSDETRLLKTWPDAGPTLVWDMKIGEGYATPVVQGDRLVFFHRMNDTAVVDCLHPSTGKRHWQFTYPDDYQDRYGFNGGPRSSPVIDGNRVYTLSAGGVLHCLNLADGHVVWKRDITADYKVGRGYFGVGSTPLVEGDRLIVQVGADGGPCVVALDKRTGREIWRAGDRWTASYASPIPAVVHGKRRVFVFAGGDSRPPTGGLLAIDPADGTIDFRFPWRGRRYESVNAASPVIVGNQVLVSASYHTGTALLDIRPDGTPKPAWTTTELGAHWNTPVYRDGYVYAFDGGDQQASLVCLEWATGRLVWRKTIEWTENVQRGDHREPMSYTPMRGSLLWADGVFYCLGEMGHLLSLDLTPAGCKVIDRAWLFTARETFGLPVLSRGLLYVVQTKLGFLRRDPPRLLCYDLRAAGPADKVP